MLRYCLFQVFDLRNLLVCFVLFFNFRCFCISFLVRCLCICITSTVLMLLPLQITNFLSSNTQIVSGRRRNCVRSWRRTVVNLRETQLSSMTRSQTCRLRSLNFELSWPRRRRNSWLRWPGQSRFQRFSFNFSFQWRNHSFSITGYKVCFKSNKKDFSD